MSIEIVDVKPFQFSREVPMWHLTIVAGNLGKVHMKQYILFELPIVQGCNIKFKTVSDGIIGYLIDSIRTMELRPIPKDTH